MFGDGTETQQVTTKKVQLLAVNLLRNCVQAAACRIDNEGGTPDRSTQRIELLLQLLPEDFEELGGKFKPGLFSLTRVNKLQKKTALELKVRKQKTFKLVNCVCATNELL